MQRVGFNGKETIEMGEGLKRAVRATALTRLNDDHEAIMRLMARCEKSDEVLLSSAEISRPLSRSAAWALLKLKRLEALGLVERAGVTFANARTWRLTSEGRRVCRGGAEEAA